MITEYKNWRRDKPGLGVWNGRGKVSFSGIGHSRVDRRWDGKTMSDTLGQKAIDACDRALADAGISRDDVDGMLCCPESMAGFGIAGAAGMWAPRPFFAPPYDSEDGLTIVTGKWLVNNMGLKNVQFAPADVPNIGEQVGMAAQAIADGLCHTALIVYTGANLEGRYRRGGENASDTAKGNRQWSVPWGNHGGNDFINTFAHQQYLVKYGGVHDDTGPFVVNQHRNGRMTPWSFYTTHEPRPLTMEDYTTSRYILRPLRIWDCDRPVHAVTAYLLTTAERAKNMKQKPVYVLSHSQHNARQRSTQSTLDELEAATDLAAKLMYEGSGLKPSEVDIFNPYDGYSLMTQFWLEAFQWHGVKRGEAFAFYKDIAVEGRNPFCSGGGNLGNGRTRSAMYTDSIEQLRGTTGQVQGFDMETFKNKRKVKVKAETAMMAFCPPMGGGWLALGTSPN